MRIISSALCLGVTLLAGSAAMAAGKAQPYAIRGEAAVPLAAGPATTAHFGCELRLWASTQRPCYGPEASRKAYGLASVIASGYDGTGKAIVIVDAYGSPTIAADLATFDALFGVPAPPSLRQIRMPGTRRSTIPTPTRWAGPRRQASTFSGRMQLRRTRKLC